MTLIGCCGWAEAQARYVERFATIELQTPFYQPPSNAVALRWKALAPESFQFCMKAWQLITHTPASPTYRRLAAPVSAQERDLYGSFRPTEQVALAWERTREIASLLDARVLVFQCPKSFGPTRENVRNLRGFFEGMERGPWMLAWEPRGEDWAPELVRKLCAGLGLVHCVDPFVSDPVYGDALYWRLHGLGGYRYRYTDEDLDLLRAKLREFSEGRGPNYLMFNNIWSKQDALRMMEGSRTPG